MNRGRRLRKKSAVLGVYRRAFCDGITASGGSLMKKNIIEKHPGKFLFLILTLIAFGESIVEMIF